MLFYVEFWTKCNVIEENSAALIGHTVQEYQTGKLRPTASLLLVQSVVHYKDIPEKKTAPMQYFNKLEFREIPTFPLKSQISTHTEMSCFMSSIILCEDFY
ncbi:hypothetical protein T05_16269 [Trichinella murrelli]|uniref:Uncharacterized protein n=1 Tax=Trichinella murrelli TaxID=144512 RepID=A0A0V0T5F7_9BILA|nr:hypothetical protein T05_6006 [Trichinella murrelli]KRX34297.1 hypothetical protein T05_16269 [Trichinella murrelli]